MAVAGELTGDGITGAGGTTAGTDGDSEVSKTMAPTVAATTTMPTPAAGIHHRLFGMGWLIT